MTEEITAKNNSGVLVYDRYFTKKPGALSLMLKKGGLSCALCVSMMFCLFGVYRIPVTEWLAVLMCVGFMAFFCLLFSFVKKRLCVPVITFFTALLIQLNFDEFLVTFKNLIDIVLLRLHGTVFATRDKLWYPQKYIQTSDGVDLSGYTEGVMISLILVIAIISMICAGSMFKKARALPPLIAFITLCVPVLIAQNLSFNIWFIPVIALIAGQAAVSRAYTGGAVTRSSLFLNYRSDLRREERSFCVKAARLPAVKRAKANGVHYSKYFSAAICAAAIFAASGVLASSLMLGSGGVDYTDFYSFINSFKLPELSSPFKSTNPGMGYFVQASNGVGTSLSIGRPGDGDDEIIKITNTGEKTFLRGDYGINFTGTGWTSPVSSEPLSWRRSSLKTNFRPAEPLVLNTLFDSLKNSVSLRDPTSSGDITVKYLCETDVVFLPAYTSDFSYYDSKMFRVYGDFAVRASDNYRTIDEIHCTALTPLANYTGTNSENKRRMFDTVSFLNNKFNFDHFFDAYADNAGCCAEYEEFVNDTYLSVPYSISEDIRKFLIENELYDADITEKSNIEKYDLCVKITDFLKDNYTYSLTAPNSSSNPVHSFLYETKAGHCALYASSMTLMLRDMGIPARYATGFIAPHTRSDRAVTLTAADLHAWCEVYFKGAGWISFDPTSAAMLNGGGNGTGGDTESSDTDSDPEFSYDANFSDIEDDENSDDEDSSDPSVPIIDPETPDTPDDPDTPSGGDPSNIFMNDSGGLNFFSIAVVGVCALGIVALIVYLAVKFRNLGRDAKIAVTDTSPDRSADDIYDKIISILSLCKIKQKAGELPDKFFARADRLLRSEYSFKRGSIRTALAPHTDLLLKIGFGKDEISDEELAAAVEIFKDIYAAADARLVLIGRFKLRSIVTRRESPA